MDLATDSIQFPVFLLPGFLAMKVVALKCDVKRPAQHELLIDALLHSVAVYMLLGLLGLEADLAQPPAIFAALLLSMLTGFVVAEAKNGEWMARVLASRRFGISTHDKIFYLKATEKLFGKWHLVGLKNGKEVFGIIRHIDTNTNEMLIEGARWLVGGRLAGQPDWLYLPPDSEVEYVRAESS
jgi:hypothetical protein